ncbi:MAG TPA: hypothetical protein VNO35_29000 [Steroidobacteraceae bacterium]|nr:hypothetical protein [Steroidobacteraceae bacterium]
MPAIDTRSALLVGLVVLALWNGWGQWKHRAMHPPDGQIAQQEPLQADALPVPTVSHGRWTLTPRAHYDITARVLGNESYRFDALAALVPEDLALGWGPMSDTRVINTLDMSQSARFYSWRPHADTPVTIETIITHSANTHVIPLDERVARQLADVRVGEVVRLTGTLVDANRDDGAWVRTSLTRNDTGAGACEVLLVDGVERKWP